MTADDYDDAAPSFEQRICLFTMIFQIRLVKCRQSFMLMVLKVHIAVKETTLFFYVQVGLCKKGFTLFSKSNEIIYMLSCSCLHN